MCREPELHKMLEHNGEKEERWAQRRQGRWTGSLIKDVLGTVWKWLLFGETGKLWQDALWSRQGQICALGTLIVTAVWLSRDGTGLDWRGFQENKEVISRVHMGSDGGLQKGKHVCHNIQAFTVELPWGPETRQRQAREQCDHHIQSFEGGSYKYGHVHMTTHALSHTCVCIYVYMCEYVYIHIFYICHLSIPLNPAVSRLFPTVPYRV